MEPLAAASDLPDGWLTRLEELLKEYETMVDRVHGLMDRNRIFIDRMRDVGTISTADAIQWGYTGPILRSTGAPLDLRNLTVKQALLGIGIWAYYLGAKLAGAH